MLLNIVECEDWTREKDRDVLVLRIIKPYFYILRCLKTSLAQSYFIVSQEQDLEDWYQISRDVLEYECGATPPSPIPPADQKQQSPPEEISIMDEKTAPPGFPPFPFETIQDCKCTLESSSL